MNLLVSIATNCCAFDIHLEFEFNALIKITFNLILQLEVVLILFFYVRTCCLIIIKLGIYKANQLGNINVFIRLHCVVLCVGHKTSPKYQSYINSYQFLEISGI